MSECRALVTYNEENAPLAVFNKQRITLQIHDLPLKVHQNWNSHGVAGVLWRASVVLCNLLMSDSNLVQGKRVVELGAGTGIPSVIASHLGAASVIATDLQENLDLLNTNIKLNHNICRGTVEQRALDWTKNIDETLLHSADIILGADIVYMEETFPHLLRTISDLSHEGTILLLSCKVRYDRDTNFFNVLNAKYNCKLVLTDTEDKSVLVYKCQINY